mgnify:CR=1 FL=1
MRCSATALRTLASLLVKELRQLRRDPKILPVLFAAPILQLLILGYAATTDVTRVELAVADLDHSAASRALVQRFISSGSFRLVATADAQPQLDPLLASGAARLALTIPANFSGRQAAGAGAAVQVLADGSDAAAGTVGLGYALGTLQQAGPPAAIELQPTVLYNPDLRSRYFMVPGVLAMIIMVMTMILTAMALVREKELGTMEQLLVTPLSPGMIILGKVVPYALVGLIEILTALPIVLFFFRVPLRGSLLLLLVLCLPFMLSTLGLGLLVSTLSHTQQQAMMLAAFVFMLPQIYLSGFVFPIQNMPAVFQWVTYLVPLRYFVVILRGVFLKGVGIDVLWPQVAALLVLAGLILAAARLRFARQLG